MNKSIKYLLQFFAIISFLNISAQSGEPFANVKTPEEATASLKLLSEKYKVGEENLISILIKKGADVNLRNSYGTSPLFMAVLANSTQGVRILLEASARPNILHPKSGGTPLFYAAQKKNIEMVKALIKAKANVNKATTRGLTPLFIATVMKENDIIKELLEAGADPNIYDNKTKTSPLYIAAENGHFKNLRALLDTGAKIDHQKTDGSTALFIASSKGHAVNVTYLLAIKANPHLCKKEGDRVISPLAIAKENKRGQIVSWLQKDLPSCSDRLEKDGWDLTWMSGYFSMEAKMLKIKKGNKAYKITFKGNSKNEMSFDCYAHMSDDIVKDIFQIFVDGKKIYEGRYTKAEKGLQSPKVGKNVIDTMSKGSLCEIRVIGNLGGEFLAASLEFSLKHFSQNLTFACMKRKQAQEDKETGRCKAFVGWFGD
ncbi:ankyrin repeat domain-containing protein [Wocania ichthyoenteri]|uniref:ankyrin repeat domain-containing protein n=1 Tax=Wocania ichthyoenteri TaxID=1230531 RepID=UPI00053DC9B1|nr:ankyrin repeat domain-containing protein [Wocania ichthyoenteri]